MTSPWVTHAKAQLQGRCSRSGLGGWLGRHGDSDDVVPASIAAAARQKKGPAFLAGPCFFTVFGRRDWTRTNDPTMSRWCSNQLSYAPGKGLCAV